MQNYYRTITLQFPLWELSIVDIHMYVTANLHGCIVRACTHCVTYSIVIQMLYEQYETAILMEKKLNFIKIYQLWTVFNQKMYKKLN